MAKYIVVAAALGIPTGETSLLTHLPDFRRFVRGETVDTADFDTPKGRDKIQRLLQRGALRSPEDVQQAQQKYQTPFDIPLDRDPGGTAPDEQVIKLPGDDIEDDPADDEQPVELVPLQPSLVDGTPEARLAGDAVDPAETGGDAASDGTEEELADRDGDGKVDAPSRGASTAVWQQYAQRTGLDVPADASRTEIQEAHDKRAAAEQG